MHLSTQLNIKIYAEDKIYIRKITSCSSDELKYWRTFSPILLRFAIPIITTKQVNHVVTSIFLLLPEPDRLIWWIRTAFRSCFLCFSFTLTSSLSLLLFESIIFSKFMSLNMMDKFRIFTSIFECYFHPKKSFPLVVDLVLILNLLALRPALLRSIGMQKQ